MLTKLANVGLFFLMFALFHISTAIFTAKGRPFQHKLTFGLLLIFPAFFAFIHFFFRHNF